MNAKHPLLSIIITSYTMDRFKDICDLFDSIKNQTLMEIHRDSMEIKSPNLSQSLPISTSSPIEVIFVAERSKELYEKVKEKGREIFGNVVEIGGDSVEIHRDLMEIHRDSTETQSSNLNKSQQISINHKVLFNDGEPGLSAARNLGIKHAQGDIIAFVDDDVVLFPNWAEEVIKGFDDESIIGVTGPALPLWEDEKSMSWFPEEFYWIISCTAWFDCNEKREVRNAWGMNMAFKKEAFELCGLFRNEYGFHKGLFAEDNEFSLRVKAKTGKKIIFCPEMRLWHRVHKYRISLKFIKERAYWIGRSRRNLKRTYRGNKDLLSPEHALLRRIIIRLFWDILKDLVRSPVIVWRKVCTTFVVLFFVTLGYCCLFKKK